MGMDNMKKQEIEALEQRAYEYVKRNRRKATNGRRCVDGRYDEEYFGRIAVAGGDLGFALALARVNAKRKLGLSTQEIYELVMDATEGTPHFHTDEHTAHSGGLIGCGHLARASENPKEYGVSSDVTNELIRLAKTDAEENNRPIEEAELEGNHEEIAVLVVTSKEYTVDPNERNKQEDGEGDGEMYFIYDVNRTAEYVQTLVERIKAEALRRDPPVNLGKLTANDLAEALKEQTNQTLHFLAKGKAIITVDADTNWLKKNPSVKFKSVVQ